LEKGGQRPNGVGDIVMTVFLSPSKSGRIIWGVGPVLLLPTATNNALGDEGYRDELFGETGT
jgi:hypothetical protein